MTSAEGEKVPGYSPQILNQTPVDEHLAVAVEIEGLYLSHDFRQRLFDGTVHAPHIQNLSPASGDVRPSTTSLCHAPRSYGPLGPSWCRTLRTSGQGKCAACIDSVPLRNGFPADKVSRSARRLGSGDLPTHRNS